VRTVPEVGVVVRWHKQSYFTSRWDTMAQGLSWLLERYPEFSSVPAGEARVVRIQRTYDSPIEDVWDALTTPERISRWFLPISGDYRVGGRYQLEGNAGGEILDCDRPHRFRVSWVYGPTPDEGAASELTIRLTPDGAEATSVELEHVAMLAVPGDEGSTEYCREHDELCSRSARARPHRDPQRERQRGQRDHQAGRQIVAPVFQSGQTILRLLRGNRSGHRQAHGRGGVC
jgi:uncharacterized protein YndB with AHSA1/START domain